MSDERDRDREEDDDGAEDEPEGLGLTDEFARLEEEIEQEQGPREVRFDETDSTEFAVPPGAGRETAEWAAPEAFEEDEAAAEEEAVAGEEDPATEVHPEPSPAGAEAD